MIVAFLLFTLLVAVFAAVVFAIPSAMLAAVLSLGFGVPFWTAFVAFEAIAVLFGWSRIRITRG